MDIKPIKANLRVQRKRSKGFKMPSDAVYAGRGSKWGNPFKLDGDMIMVDAGHRRKIFSKWVCFYDNGGHTIEEVVKLYKDLLLDLNSHNVEPEIIERFRWMRDNIQLLHGKKVACWCKKDSCCHADVLIELANY